MPGSLTVIIIVIAILTLAVIVVLVASVSVQGLGFRVQDLGILSSVLALGYVGLCKLLRNSNHLLTVLVVVWG